MSSAYPVLKKNIHDLQSFITDNTGDPKKLCSVVIMEADIVAAIDAITNSAADGPDDFHVKLLKKNCKKELAKPLQILWSSSLQTGTIPELLKTAIITPNHKRGSKGSASKYRPVALASHLVKIFERVVRKNIVLFLERNGALNNGQHSFRQGRSCLSQLLLHYEKILEYI